MKLFKNRGDIYIPKNGKANSTEKKVLFSLLIVIVIFTVAFIALLAGRYNSAAEFFGEGEVTVNDNTEFNEVQLPSITGKTNFLIFETDDTGELLHYIILFQADMDNKAYKAAALSPDMKADGKALTEIYSQGGGAALQKKLTETLGCEIDYYAGFETSSFVDFTDKLGNILYNIDGDIRYSGGKEDDKYTIHLNEGEKKLGGKEISNLLRYYSDEKKDYFSEGELALKTVTTLLNEDNYKKADSLFRLFIKSAKTDITVRNFENGKNSVYVFCMINKDITVYTVNAQYDEACILTQNSAKIIKGYFSK